MLLFSSLFLSDFFFFYSYGDPRDLHAFPTRRSSDLGCAAKKKPRLSAPRDDLFGRAGAGFFGGGAPFQKIQRDRKSTRLNSSHLGISYAVFCLKKKKNKKHIQQNTKKRE